VKRRKFISSGAALGLSAGLITDSAFGQTSNVKPPLIVRDDINALPQLGSFPSPNLIHNCNIIRDLRNAYVKSHTALLGDLKALDALQAATKAAFEAEFKVKNAQINAFKKKYPKSSLLDQKRLIAIQTWNLVKDLGKFIIVDIAPLAVKSLSPAGLLFTGVTAISAANDIRLQIIDASNGANNGGALLYSFFGARNTSFNMLAMATDDKSLVKMQKGTSVFFAIVNGGLLVYKSMRLVGDYQDLQILDAYYANLIAEHDRMTKLLREAFSDRDSFLELLISQQSSTAKALEQIYIASSFSSCQSVPVIGLSRFLDSQFPQNSVSRLP